MDVGVDPEDRSRRELRRLLAAARVVPSVDDRTWRSLLAAYLDGRPKATHILGDYLEGEGHPRIRPGAVDKRLRYALGLLPAVLAHEIACDFVQHVVEEVGGRADAAIVQELEVKRRWLRGAETDSSLKAARTTVQLAAALRRIPAEAAAQAMASSPSASVAQRTSHLAAIAFAWRAAERRAVEQMDDRYRSEVRWQVAHLRARLG